MMGTSFESIFFLLSVAWVSDVIIGDPLWFYRYIPHPVTWFGWLIHQADTAIHYPKRSALFQRIWGILHLMILIGVLGWASWCAQQYLLKQPYGWIIVGLISGVFLAQNSLYRHVKKVASQLQKQDLDQARSAVGKIVGRDIHQLNGTGVSRAAIESLSESFNDGVVAPFFWLAVAGLPGIVIYKLANTADSMIGHKNDRYLYYGWAAARFDDLLNLIPARLSGLLLILAALLGLSIRSAKRGLRIMMQDARLHASPNAGWPEAAMAGILDIRLGGPRWYQGEEDQAAWFHPNGREQANFYDIYQALHIYRLGCLLMAAFGIGTIGLIILI